MSSTGNGTLKLRSKPYTLQQLEERKAKVKLYRQSARYKEIRRVYESTEERKEKRKEYDTKRRKDPRRKEYIREYQREWMRAKTAKLHCEVSK